MLLALFDLDEEKTRRVCARVRSGLRRMLLADGAPALKAVFSIGYHLPDGETADPNRLIAAARGNVFRPLSGPNLELDSALLQKAFPHMRLSTREAEAAALLLHGKSNQEIAKAMYVSLPTVKKHIAKVLEEASVKSRSEFIARGLR